MNVASNNGLIFQLTYSYMATIYSWNNFDIKIFTVFVATLSFRKSSVRTNFIMFSM